MLAYLRPAHFWPDPVRISELACGQKFIIYWEGGAYGNESKGTVVRLNISRARVRLTKPVEEVDFVDGKGKAHHFGARQSFETDWAPGTLVVPLDEFDERFKEEPVAENSDDEDIRFERYQKGHACLKPRVYVDDDGAPAVVPKSRREERLAKEAKAKASLKVVKAKGNGKSVKEAAEAVNDCLCGCGAKVKRRFAVGHDARMFGWFKKVADGRMPFAELPKPVQKRVGDIKGLKKELAAH